MKLLQRSRIAPAPRGSQMVPSPKVRRNFLNSFITNVGQKVAIILGDKRRFGML